MKPPQPTYHYPTQFPPLQEVDKPQRTGGVPDSPPPTPSKAPRGHSRNDSDWVAPAPAPAPWQIHPKSAGSSPVLNPEYAIGENLPPDEATDSSAYTKSSRLEAVKETNTPVEHDVSQAHPSYNTHTIGKKEGSTGPVLEARMVYQAERRARAIQ